VASFVGTVRDHDSDRTVTRLDYTVHPTATGVLRRVADQVCAAYPVIALAAVHRIGSLDVGDLAVVVAVSCPHRGAAFDACRKLIDDLKATAPIWKHQVFADGSEEWVGTP
jgi:molybdopterin synthase catalytic subunit